MKKVVLSRARFAGLVLLLAAVVLVGACSQQQAAQTGKTETSAKSQTTEKVQTAEQPKTTEKPQAAEKPQSGGVLKIAWVNNPTVFGYTPEISGLSVAVTNGVLEGLLDFDNSLRFKPTSLATGFEVAKDGKSTTITVRKGVKFHDGTDFNGAAAKWNLDQVLGAKMLGTANWTSVDLVDDYTVRINLKQPDGTFPGLIGRTTGLQISPTAVQKNGKEWARTNPVGTGPFKFKSFERDVSLKYERFDGYWGEKAYLDGVEWQFVKDPMLQEAAFKAREVNMVYYASPQQLKTLGAAGFETVAKKNGMAALMPDSKNPNAVLANKKVREALEYAIDRKAIADALGDGFFQAVDQIGVPEYPLSYDPNLKGRAYDPAKAKQLLAEAGYPNGFKTKIIEDQGFNDMDFMVAIQKYWKAVGVDAELESVPRAKYEEYRTKGWSDGWLIAEMGGDTMYLNTIDRFLSPVGNVYVSTARPASWTEMRNETIATVDPEAIGAKTRSMVKVVFDDATFMPLWQNIVGATVLEKNVRNSGFLTDRYHWLRWSPERAWIAK